MKRKHCLLFTLIITSLYLTSCNVKSSEKELDIDKESIKTKIITDDIEKKASSKSEKSEKVNKLPWEKNEEFKKAIEKIETRVLMSAYRTVLRDPLPGEEYNVHLAAKSLAGIVVPPGAVFSQNASIGPYTESKGYKKGPTYMGPKITTTEGGGVCKIASTLYNVAIYSNLEVVERYNHTMPVPYVPYGQDATVAYGFKDLKFKNNTDFPILIWAEGIENRLYIGFYGKEKPPKVEWHHETLEIREANIQYINNPKLKKNDEKMIIEGMDGALIKSWVTIEDETGNIKTKNLRNSSYLPMPYVIETNKEK
ncbi:VanW family protein [Gottschalkia acidurici 9a]|uniref:VanW family protein n=1 Tax=Gottschalkia acidurici (strain ATCC 7906 / DSM 604 / BCRC 14475 / CIP 104303 / KCTC 5404 / NCIMB 10678 / 9a) TaxID=1128398 RepID=K0AZS0_GOTA9|nr:VanW family protein [Gottschalkia acidurici]AFS78774.1 VanW family protein [Gottschalkia acidurici 9a]